MGAQATRGLGAYLGDSSAAAALVKVVPVAVTEKVTLCPAVTVASCGTERRQGRCPLPGVDQPAILQRRQFTGRRVGCGGKLGVLEHAGPRAGILENPLQLIG